MIRPFWKLPEDRAIRIYDLDGTLIDSSHRARYDRNGKLDLDHWRENNTKDNIFQDSLLPMYAQYQKDLYSGDYIILCTARELTKHDYEFLFMHNILNEWVKRIISRPKGNTLSDWNLKQRQLRMYFNLKPFQHMPKYFYDDNPYNLGALSDLGAITCNAREWNLKYA